jgi:hypothetical protein
MLVPREQYTLDFSFLFFFILSFFYSHVHTLLRSFLPTCLLTLTHPFQAGPVLPLSLVLLKKRDKPNKEDKVFLLLELRIAIQKYS